MLLYHGALIQILKQVHISNYLAYMQMYNPVGNTLYTNISTPVTYWIPFSGALSAPRSAGVSVTSFHTLITNDFSVNNTI